MDYLVGFQHRWQNLFPLKLATIISGVLGTITLISAIVYHTDLKSVELLEEVHKSDCHSIKNRRDVEVCHLLDNWHTCSVAAIVISLLQVLCALMLFKSRVVSNKTQIWCAVHAFLFIALATNAFLTVVTKHAINRSEVSSYIRVSTTTWFATFATIDVIAILSSIVFIIWYYGSYTEVRFEYRDYMALSTFE